MGYYRQSMKYVDFSKSNPRCIHCFISDRAYASIITEVMTNGRNETGGVLIGYIINRAWYIVESVDPGINTVNEVAFFQWDGNYVNHQVNRLSKIYQRPLTILGFWHRHPGSMDYFSGQDEETIQSNLLELKQGLLSMLVNIDPSLRMTFYYCFGREIMKLQYDVGNKYFPAELLKYADAEELASRAAKAGAFNEIYYKQVINLDSVAARKGSSALKGEHTSGNAISSSCVASSVSQMPAQGNTQYGLSNETIKKIVETVVAIEGPSRTEYKRMQDSISTMQDAITKMQDAINLLAKLSAESNRMIQASLNLPTESNSENQDHINREIIEDIANTVADKVFKAIGEAIAAPESKVTSSANVNDNGIANEVVTDSSANKESLNTVLPAENEKSSANVQMCNQNDTGIPKASNENIKLTENGDEPVSEDIVAEISKNDGVMDTNE